MVNKDFHRNLPTHYPINGTIADTLRTPAHQTECSGSSVIVLTEKKTPTKTILSVATAESEIEITNNSRVRDREQIVM